MTHRSMWGHAQLTKSRGAEVQRPKASFLPVGPAMNPAHNKSPGRFFRALMSTGHR
jgi:hypothetical protein